MADGESIMLEKVSYIRLVKPPTLNQYLVRKQMSEVVEDAKNKTGVTRVKGRLMPKSAKIIKEKMDGRTAEVIAKEHPEWVNEYPAYIEKWREDNLKNIP